MSLAITCFIDYNKAVFINKELYQPMIKWTSSYANPTYNMYNE